MAVTLHLSVSRRAPRGGWAWRRVHDDGQVIEGAGAEAHASPYRLRLHALVEGLAAAEPDVSLVVRTSDTLLVDVATRHLPAWSAIGFQKKGGIQSLDLVRRLEPLLQQRAVRFEVRDSKQKTMHDEGASLLARRARDACEVPEGGPQVALGGRATVRADVEVVAWTDGGSRGNPGPGGWGVVLVHLGAGVALQRRGGASEVTNNRMELMAIGVALSTLTRRTRVEVRTDSRFCIDALTKWMPSWKRRGWRKADGEPPSNLELFQRLEPLLARHDVVFTWVPGHAGEPGNELADHLCNAAMDALTRGEEAAWEHRGAPPFEVHREAP